MRWRLCLAYAAIAVLCVPTVATAAEGWVSPTASGRVITGYGVQCVAGMHRGVDLAADAGEEVFAPTDGTVRFAGRVPADGGGTCGAVTIELPDGLLVSLLPLEEVFVQTGDIVGRREAVGTLRACGDDSSAVAHLHLGVRRGDAYLDPSGMLPGPCEAPAEGAPIAAPSPPEPEPPSTPHAPSAAQPAPVETGVAAQASVVAESARVAASGVVPAVSGETCGSTMVMRSPREEGMVRAVAPSASRAVARRQLARATSFGAIGPAPVAGASGIPFGLAAATAAVAASGVARSRGRRSECVRALG